MALYAKYLYERQAPQAFRIVVFLLEHRSQQQEAGFLRQAWCKIMVVVSGQELQALTQRITLGSKISVVGFISSQQGRDGLNQLVLHAEQIELIDTGD